MAAIPSETRRLIPYIPREYNTFAVRICQSTVCLRRMKNYDTLFLYVSGRQREYGEPTDNHVSSPARQRSTSWTKAAPISSSYGRYDNEIRIILLILRNIYLTFFQLKTFLIHFYNLESDRLSASTPPDSVPI